MRRLHAFLVGFAVFTLSSVVATATQATTLETVQSRGQLVCGVNTWTTGLSAPDSQGVYRGLDVDYCRALAAAVPGDPGKVRFVPTDHVQRFTLLKSGELDVLARNATITLTRETQLGFLGIGVDFYDGQGIMVPRAANISTAKQLDGMTICVLSGSSHGSALSRFSERNKLSIQRVIVSSMDELVNAYQSSRCNGITLDASQLAAVRVSNMRAPADHVILPERISKEPLGPLVRRDDVQWAAIAKYVLMAWIAAEEMGITQANVDELRSSSDPDIRKLLGTDPGLGRALGIDEAWAYREIKAVGNYGETYDRELGHDSTVQLDRGLNNLWTRGGLMYALPLQ